MATLMKIDGTKIEVFPKNKRNGFTLKEVYEIICCSMVEIVGTMNDGRLMFVDEEGKLKKGWGALINPQATELYRVFFGVRDVIVGNALLVTDEEFQ